MSDNTKQSNMQKMKFKPIPIIILVSVSVALIIGIVIYAITRSSENSDNQVQVNLNQTNLKQDNTESLTSSTATTIEIIMEDSAIPVGTTLRVTAIVSPEDTEHALNWTSSNSDVFTVDSNGRITIMGTGTAALTATIGTVSDAVAIEGLASVTSGSANGYPVYTSGSMASNGDAAGNTAGGSSNTGDAGNITGGSSNAGGQGNSNGSGSDSGSSGGDSSGSDGNNSGGSGGGNSGSNGNNSGGSSGGDNSTGSSSDDIATVLPDNGFTQVMSNVYVCEESGTYYGEIITQPNVTIVYIKQRSASFDSKVQNVIQQLLPEEYGQVWNNYLSANTDRTFTAKGRKVRIVVASGGGHSQIVIYN